MNKECKFYFPVHLDGGNRGCEGIAKGTAAILGEPKESLIGLCRNVTLDNQLGIGNKVSLQPYRKVPFWFRIVNKVYLNAMNVLRKDKFEKGRLSRFYKYSPFINQMKPGDIMLSTGGDMMCYNDNFVISTTEWAKKRGAKTILWGCSMDEKNLTPRKRKVLDKFDMIYARESLSYEFFKGLGLQNVVCFPDPAFILSPENTPLPSCFNKGKVIGINLSNFTVGGFHLDTPFGYEVRKLLDYLFRETNYEILLIPHVLWKGQDDRILASSILREYKKFSNRITILESENINYLQIRYVISNCHIFIGGRTHAVISAYSTCVPSIALGYSIKSRGIAKDIGMPSEYVIDCKMIKKQDILKEVFRQMEKDYVEIKNLLKSVMPSYIERTYGIKSIIEKL